MELSADEGEGVVRRGRLGSALPAQGFVGEGYGGEALSWEEDLLVGVDVVVDVVSQLAGEAEEGGCGMWAWAWAGVGEVAGVRRGLGAYGVEECIRWFCLDFFGQGLFEVVVAIMRPLLEGRLVGIINMQDWIDWEL